MKPETWVQALDLPNLLRYSDRATVKRFLTVAFRKAMLEERERVASYIEEQNRMVNDLLGENRHDAFVSDITKGIRSME